MATRQWVRLPSQWINDGGLAALRWKHGGEGSDRTAALMALTAIAHAADSETGIARVTYDHLCATTLLSRSKISKGLDALEQIEVIEREPDQVRSAYKLVKFDPNSGWAKFPAKSMYSGGVIAAFADFQLRQVAELDALKLFFLMVARRNRSSNIASIGYDKIVQYTQSNRGRIKTALSVLAAHSLVHIERIPSMVSDDGVSNAYRVVGIDAYAHMGTRGRAMDAAEFE